MRGHAIHNSLAKTVANRFRRRQFTTYLEYKVILPDGRVNFIDVYVTRGSFAIACEIETTPRYVTVNVAKGMQLGIPVWVVVPNRTVGRAVSQMLRRRFGRPRDDCYRIFRQAQLIAELNHRFSSANEREN